MGGTVLSDCLAAAFGATGHRAAVLLSLATAVLTLGSVLTGGTGMPKD
jgi:hypothetical protein